jgi:hypothetical protein
MKVFLTLTLAISLAFLAVFVGVSRITAEAVVGADQAVTSFRFISWGDAQDENGNLAKTASQAQSLNPAFTIFNGDLEDNGVTTDRMDAMTAAFGSLLPKTFLVRGNHDDHVSGSAGLWQNYFTALNRTLPSGVTNYVGMNSSSAYLTYSFDYGNSRFLGVDVPGDADLLTSSEITFLDTRLTDAENLGLTHAFIFFHGPEYCVESTHCSCTAANDSKCTPSAFVNLINKHPIVSATFHGHEHMLSWTHMDNTRVAGLTHSYEEILTSPSGGWTYNDYAFPARMDYYYPNMGSSQGFAAIDVNGDTFAVSFYKVGTTTPVWSRTFSKSGASQTSTPGTNATATATRTRTRTSTQTARGNPGPVQAVIYLPVIYKYPQLAGATPAPTQTPTRTSRRTRTSTPTSNGNQTNTPTRTPAATITHTSGNRLLKYYLVDRVLSNSDYATLASWGVDTAVVDMGINSSSSWNSVVTAAANAGINIVIWPDQGGDVSGCGWETPFNSPQNGDYIWRITNMLDALGGNPHVIGIVIAHEAMWNQGTCRTLISDMAAVKTQIKNYILTKFGRTDFKIWNYIDNISDIPQIQDYSGPSDYAKIMDVAVTWQHCAGNAESSCDTGSYSALAKINDDRNKINAAGGGVELVYIMQTFTSGGSYGTKFTLPQLENYSCEFLNTSALDGFGFYTWNAGWWPDLHSWTDLQPAVPYIHNSCVP